MALEAARRVAMAGVARLRARRSVGRPAGAFGAGVRGPPHPESPRSLADLDLAETRRRELGDERGKEIVGEAVDHGVIRGTFVGGTWRGGGRTGRVVGHGSDLVSSRWLVATGGRRPAAGIE